MHISRPYTDLLTYDEKNLLTHLIDGEWRSLDPERLHFPPVSLSNFSSIVASLVGKGYLTFTFLNVPGNERVYRATMLGLSAYYKANKVYAMVHVDMPEEGFPMESSLS